MAYFDALKRLSNYTTTENGATTYKSTLSKLYDMFALGGAYRKRSDQDCIDLFSQAFLEDPEYAVKCLFYLRDVRGGQGERRFFRVCYNWLANYKPDVAHRNMKYIAEFGRYDDLYCLIGTPLESAAATYIKEQFGTDLFSKTPSLMAKWLCSENCSSKNSRKLGEWTRKAVGLTSREYRKSLSMLRERINVLERLMSAGEWDKIEFDKIPSNAGLKYRNAFARRDVLREKYKQFAKSSTTKVNTSTLYPYEVVKKALDEAWRFPKLDDPNRLMINKYWDNLNDYFNGKTFNGIAVIDTSGSMSGDPILVALSLGMYCADKAKGPFANHFITFSRYPELIEFTGVDFCDKVTRAIRADWMMNTNIKATFDLLLKAAIENHCRQDEIPENIIIISDMEFDECTYMAATGTNFEIIEKEWADRGYKMPKLVFWNVDARNNNIPMMDRDGVTFVSGFSPVIYEQVLSGKTGQDLMYDVLNSDRYKCIG